MHMGHGAECSFRASCHVESGVPQGAFPDVLSLHRGPMTAPTKHWTSTATDCRWLEDHLNIPRSIP